MEEFLIMRNRKVYLSLSLLRLAILVTVVLALWTGCQSSASLSALSESSNSISVSSRSTSKVLGSVSKSLKSISKSIKSVSGSLSDSSSDDDEEKKDEAYLFDVKIFTAAFVRSNGSEVEFQRDLSGIAQKHGLTYWEKEPSTYLGIGSGLRMAGLQKDELNLFLDSFSARDRNAARTIRKGYELL